MQVAVVIPFFQRAPGLLKRAVWSVLAQTEVRPAVIVVDDGSPMRARDELAGIGGDSPVRVIEQANAGPAAARNRGLDHLPDEIAFVAFLDSDDTWDPGHLRNAMVAFAQGADLYFSDWQRQGEETTRFASSGVVRLEGEALPEGNCLFRYQGDLFDAILRCAPMGTSGVVYRRSIAPGLRFHENLRAGEDNLFWMGLTKAARMVVYTTRCEAFYGRGVNIAAGATWRDPSALRYLAHAARMHRLLPGIHELTKPQAQWNDEWRAELHRSYARNLLAMLRHGEAIDWSGLMAFLREEPRLLLSIARAGVWGVTSK
jgi:succinoglycan biosynthesis protein ExoW